MRPERPDQVEGSAQVEATTLEVVVAVVSRALARPQARTAEPPAPRRSASAGLPPCRVRRCGLGRGIEVSRHTRYGRRSRQVRAAAARPTPEMPTRHPPAIESEQPRVVDGHGLPLRRENAVPPRLREQRIRRRSPLLVRPGARSTSPGRTPPSREPRVTRERIVPSVVPGDSAIDGRRASDTVRGGERCDDQVVERRVVGDRSSRTSTCVRPPSTAAARGEGVAASATGGRPGRFARRGGGGRAGDRR